MKGEREYESKRVKRDSIVGESDIGLMIAPAATIIPSSIFTDDAITDEG